MIDAVHRQRAGAGRQRHPALPTKSVRTVAGIDPGRAAVGADLDLLAAAQRSGERAVYRLRRHIGDEVTARAAGVGTKRRHRGNRRRSVVSQRVAVPGPARGVAGGIDGLHRQRVGAGRQRHPLADQFVPTVVASTQVVPPFGADLDLLARSQRSGERLR